MTKPIIINGNKWVQLSQLSRDQARLIRSWLPVDSLHTVLFQGIELTECLDFDIYDYWFNSHQMSKQKQAYLDF
jgi:hypothetical protein